MVELFASGEMLLLFLSQKNLWIKSPYIISLSTLKEKRIGSSLSSLAVSLNPGEKCALFPYFYVTNTTLATPFARLYDIETLQTRILAELPEGVEHILYEITVDDEDTPDMSKNLGVKVNRPMRCLLIRKST